MSALNAIPFQIQGAVLFLMGSYLLYLLSKANKPGRATVIAFVVLCYGMSLFALLRYLQVDRTLAEVVLWSSIMLWGILYGIGVYVSYTKGSDQTKLLWRTGGKYIAKGALYMLLIIAILGLLMRMGGLIASFEGGWLFLILRV